MYLNGCGNWSPVGTVIFDLRAVTPLHSASCGDLTHRAASPVFLFLPSSGYMPADTLSSGAGFLVEFGGPEGMESGRIGQQAVDSVTSDPPGIVVSPFFGYTTGYSGVSLIEPGRGYRVRVTQPGRVVIRRTEVGILLWHRPLKGAGRNAMPDRSGSP